MFWEASRVLNTSITSHFIVSLPSFASVIAHVFLPLSSGVVVVVVRGISGQFWLFSKKSGKVGLIKWVDSLQFFERSDPNDAFSLKHFEIDRPSTGKIEKGIPLMLLTGTWLDRSSWSKKIPIVFQKITTFVNMWNLGQLLENRYFANYCLIKVWIWEFFHAHITI